MSSRTILRSSPIQTVVPKRSVISDHIFFFKASSHSAYFKTVQNAFKKMIGPIYGDQKNALAKIKNGEDRTCEIMFKYDNPLGLIVYKNQLQSEYGLVDALELKTLFLFNPDKNSGNGFGSQLFQRIDEIAQEKRASVIYCTASSKVKSSIKCALKNGYKISKIVEENEDRILYLLIKEL